MIVVIFSNNSNSSSVSGGRGAQEEIRKGDVGSGLSTSAGALVCISQ